MQNSESNSESAVSGRDKRARQNLIFAVLSLCVCISIPITAIFGSQSSFGQVNDFPEYYSSAKMICNGHGSEIYKLNQLFAAEHNDFPEMQGRGIGFYIPPFSAPLLTWLGFLPPMASYWCFISSAVIALVSGTILLARSFNLKLTGTLWLLTVLCATGPAFESLKIAQLAPFLYASFAAFLYFASKKRDLAAGACLAILLLKPQELLPIALFNLAAGKTKIIASLAVLFALMVITSMFLLGPTGYSNYGELLKDSASNTQYMQPELSATLRGQLLRITDASNPLVNIECGLALVAALTLIAVGAYRYCKAERFSEGLLLLALPLGIVTAFHCHDYDLLLLSPWFVAIGHSNTQDSLSKITKLGCALLVVSLIVPIYIPLHYKWLMEAHQQLNPIFLLLALSTTLSATLFFNKKHDAH